MYAPTKPQLIKPGFVVAYGPSPPECVFSYSTKPTLGNWAHNHLFYI